MYSTDCVTAFWHCEKSPVESEINFHLSAESGGAPDIRHQYSVLGTPQTACSGVNSYCCHQGTRAIPFHTRTLDPVLFFDMCPFEQQLGLLTLTGLEKMLFT